VFSIQYEVTPDGYTICRPAGELDAFTVHQFRQTLAEIASSRHLVIDLSGVPFVDSAGLGALIGGIRRVREIGGCVVVACSRRTLASLLHTTGIDRIVTVTETVEEAAAELNAASGPAWSGLLGGQSANLSRLAEGDVVVEA
jgi:anti-sigma B factor antagonist